MRSWGRAVNISVNSVNRCLPVGYITPTCTLATCVVEGVHANDIAAMLDLAGVCIRSGHHCCQPLHRLYGVTGSARASLSFCTTHAEIDCFADELVSVIEFFRENG